MAQLSPVFWVAHIEGIDIYGNPFTEDVLLDGDGFFPTARVSSFSLITVSQRTAPDALQKKRLK